MTKEWSQDTYILIPSYKSVTPLTQFIGKLTEIVPKEYICVVDDASDDGTYEFCARQGIDCLRHDVNKGKGAALKTGFAHLTAIPQKNAKWILTMDADGQHSPDDIHIFIEKARKHPDMGLCIGAREMRLGVMPPARILSNRLTSAFLSLLSWRHIRDSQCGYRMYSRELVKSVKLRYNRFEMESEIILKAAAKNFPIYFAGVRTLYLPGGGSHISHLSDTLRWIGAVARIWCNLKFGKTTERGG